MSVIGVKKKKKNLNVDFQDKQDLPTWNNDAA